jgi:putative NIF3 family GTP cyclohydrolase 1 type 2
VLEVEAVRIAGVVPEKIITVAVCGGSGSELAEMAMKAGAQVFITGEVKHSTARWAEGAGFCVIDGGHYATENLVVPGLVRSIVEGCSSRGAEVEVVATKQQTSPFRFYSNK